MKLRVMTARAEYVVALLLDALGAGVAVLLGSRYWQTIVSSRARPFTDDVLVVSGRAIDSAPTALALVALAGVVAVLATRSVARRAIGAFIALAGIGIVWRASAAMSPVDAARARQLVREKRPRVGVSDTAVPDVSSHTVWAVLTVICGVLVVVGGVLIAVRGGRWAAMSARYEAPGRPPKPDDDDRARQRADAALWGALDRGEDPTARDPRETE